MKYLTTKRIMILRELAELDRMTPTTLASIFDKRTSWASECLLLMVREGLVSRERSQSNRTRICYSITAEGRAALAQTKT